jgi:hypothetical protein
MSLQNIKILTFIISAISVILWVISVQLFKANKTKGTVSVILSLAYTLLAGYYIYLTFFPYSSNLPITKQGLPKEAKTHQTLKSEDDLTVVLEINGNTFEIVDGDEIEISTKRRFKIVEVKGIKFEGEIKADFKGFAGNARTNDNQDIGYWITYDKVLKHWQLEGFKDKYEIQVLQGGEKIGCIYVIFTN